MRRDGVVTQLKCWLQDLCPGVTEFVMVTEQPHLHMKPRRFFGTVIITPRLLDDNSGLDEITKEQERNIERFWLAMLENVIEPSG